MSIGTQIAGYRLEREVGRGGMGIVYRAHDVALERSVALKLLALAEDRDFRERFLVESRLAAALEHPNVVPVHDAGEADGQLYLAMRYVEGTDLKRLLREKGPLEPARAIAICAQVAAALDAAHARGLVHRDVKPSNVLLDHNEHAYLADFGLTRRLSEQAPGFESGLSLGTPAYVAPEQIEGREVDGRADQYSLACMLTECLTGEPPFPRGSEAATLFAHLEEPPPTPEALERVVPKALAKDPAARYETCASFVADARKALGLEPKRLRWPLAAAGIGAALVGAALLAFLLTRGDGGIPSEPGADSLVRIDPTTNTVADTMPIGRKATGVAAAGNYVWVTSFTDGTVWRIDSKTKKALVVPVQGSPTGVAAETGSVLVANGPEHSLISLDPGGGTVRYVTSLPGAASGRTQVAAGRSGIWFADATNRIAGQVDISISGGVPAGVVPVPPDRSSFVSAYEAFDGLAYGEGGIWVVGDALDRRIWHIDPLSGRVVTSIRLPFIPGAIVAGEGAVWVTSLLDDTVTRIDSATNRVTATIKVPPGVGGVAVGAGAVWVASTIARVVSRIDPRTNRVDATVSTDGIPTNVAGDSRSVWVTTTKPAPAVPRTVLGIGVLAACTGAVGSWYDESLAGAELVLLHHGGKLAGPRARDGIVGAHVAGKRVKVVLGCTDGTGATAITEARRLVEQLGARIVIGPTYAGEQVGLVEYARRRPEVAFVNGLAGGQLRNPPRNVFSFLPDGAQWMAGLGAYAYRTLGWRRAVTVTDESLGIFNVAQSAGFTAEFCSLGGTVVRRIAVPSGTQDYAPVVARIPRRVDGILATAGPQTILALAHGYPAFRGDLSRKLIVGTTAVGPELSQLGARVSSVVWSGSYLWPDRAKQRRYQKDLTNHFPHQNNPGSAFDTAYHDAMSAVETALAAVNGDLSGSERRFMAVLGRVQVDSPVGRIQLDSTRRAIAPNYIARLNGTVVRRVDRVEPSFGGLFKPTDPPPSKTTPACVKQTPPPWTR